MLTAEEIAEAADDAANLIEAKGWFRWTSRPSDAIALPGMQSFPAGNTPSKCHCVITAIPMHLYADTALAFAKWLGWDESTGINDADFIINWNDSHTSAKPVISALREFATEMRRKDSLEAA